MNWDSIKYIFQIPISWYKKIHDRVFKAYGTNFLYVKDGYYGGMEVGIDSAGFAAEVSRVAGTVKSVDDVTPDNDGNVELNAVTTHTDQTITGEKTFSNVVNVSDYSETNVASAFIDGSGQFNLQHSDNAIVKSPLVSFKNFINSGHIDFDSSVPSLEIYGYTGSGGGNIDFHTEGSSSDFTSRIIDTANNFTVQTSDKPLQLYSYYQNGQNGQDATGILIQAVNGVYQQLLTKEPNRLYSTGENNQIASRGYVRNNFARETHDHGNIGSDGKIILTISTTTPPYYIAADASGALYRKAIDSLVPDDLTTSDITDWDTATANFVTSSSLETTLSDYVTSSDLTTALSDYITSSDLTTALSDYVTSTDLTTTLEDYVTSTDLSSYVTSSDLATTLDDYVSYTEFATTLEDYVTASDLGEYLEESDFPSGFLTAASNGQNVTNLSVVTDVVWNGTSLQKKYRTLTFTNGLLTSCSNESTTTIDTPTVVTWR